MRLTSTLREFTISSRAFVWKYTNSSYVHRDWSSRYIPDSLLREAATRLQDRFLFGSDYPFITPQRWIKDFAAVKIEFKPEVREKLLWRNGQKLPAHTAVGQMRFSS